MAERTPGALVAGSYSLSGGCEATGTGRPFLYSLRLPESVLQAVTGASSVEIVPGARVRPWDLRIDGTAYPLTEYTEHRHLTDVVALSESQALQRVGCVGAKLTLASSALKSKGTRASASAAGAASLGLAPSASAGHQSQLVDAPVPARRRRGRAAAPAMTPLSKLRRTGPAPATAAPARNGAAAPMTVRRLLIHVLAAGKLSHTALIQKMLFLAPKHGIRGSDTVRSRLNSLIPSLTSLQAPGRRVLLPKGYLELEPGKWPYTAAEHAAAVKNATAAFDQMNLPPDHPRRLALAYRGPILTTALAKSAGAALPSKPPAAAVPQAPSSLPSRLSAKPEALVPPTPTARPATAAAAALSATGRPVARAVTGAAARSGAAAVTAGVRAEILRLEHPRLYPTVTSRAQFNELSAVYRDHHAQYTTIGSNLQENAAFFKKLAEAQTSAQTAGDKRKEAYYEDKIRTAFGAREAPVAQLKRAYTVLRTQLKQLKKVLHDYAHLRRQQAQQAAS